MSWQPAEVLVAFTSLRPGAYRVDVRLPEHDDATEDVKISVTANLKTAQALDLTIPPDVLKRAAKVVQ